jgi:formamidopyrimidine-DNA glycosylase
MPELPEVETTRRSLLADVVGARIVAVTVRERRLRRPLAAEFADQLRGRRVAGIDRRGKYLLFELDDGRTLLVHLGMSGSLCLTAPSTIPLRHDHVLIDLDRDRRLVFNDPRRFGLMRVGARDEFEELRAVGPDPLAAAPTLDEWKAMTRGRKMPIKSLLMDQRLLGGVGNIYANEALFQAGIRPRGAPAASPAPSWRAWPRPCGPSWSTPSPSAAARSRTTATGNGKPGVFPDPPRRLRPRRPALRPVRHLRSNGSC